MRVLVCPLDWGLGHAARCVPLIRALLANGHRVRIGAAGGGLRLLRQEFPDLEAFVFPGHAVRYSRSPAFFLPVLLWQLPRLLAGMLAESRRVGEILREHPYDLIISDGRYGVSSRTVPSIFITHQIFIRVPGRFPGIAWANRLVLAVNLRLLRRFSRVWVPDFPGADNLSGELSHQACRLENLEFIYPLARFGAAATITKALSEADSMAGKNVDVLAVISGPEPQRGLFEIALRRELRGLPGTRILVRGQPPDPHAPVKTAGAAEPAAIEKGALTEFAHLPGGDLARLFSASGLIVIRSGYTTLMELAGLGTGAAVLVPTPGQSEQEYLADHMERLGAGIRMDQEALDLGRARDRLTNLAGFSRWRNGWRDAAGKPFSLEAFLAVHPLFNRSRSPSAILDVRKTRQQ